MDKKVPLERLVGGSGTYADPHRFHSKLLSLLGQISRTQSMHRGFPAQIAKARETLAATDVTDEQREELERRILEQEYRWYWKHPDYLVNNYFLVREASYSFKPEEAAARKREEWLQLARDAREAFYAFAQEHPAIHAQFGGEVPPIADMVAEIRNRRTARP